MKLLNEREVRMQNSESERKKILIVEDEEINQLILSEILNTYDLLHAYNGEQALRMLEEEAQDLSMIILDLVLPEMSGSDVLKKIKANPKAKDIPVVIMSGQEEMEGDVLELGAIDFLTKPYTDPRVIRAKIANLIKFSESVKIVNAETHDDITGLLKMRSFLSEAENQMRRHVQEGIVEQYAIVYCDLANFKGYNLRYGIQEGDACLQKTAKILREIFQDDLISRFADDHFVVITQKDGLKEKLAMANEWIKKIGRDVHLHLKCGIKLAEDAVGDRSIPIACDQARTVCDRLINEGDQFIAVYDKKVSDEIARREYIVEHLDEAIREGYLKVYLQPVVRSLTGYLCGAEALVRWIDPKLGFISPGEFIPVLEDAQQIHKVDSFVIREICRTYRSRRDNNEPVIPISFNLSRLDFVLTDIQQVIMDASDEFMVPREMLNVEITESMFVRNASQFSKDISRIKEAGFKVWMDDFGSGYSSLNLLKDYEFDELKIDMAFLSSFSEKSKNILKSIVRMAKEIGIQTLAEGVETKEQYEFLRSIGCEKIQGYYFGKPEPMGTIIPHCQEKGILVETRAWSDFYDKAGKINFMDERSFALFRDSGTEIHFMYANEAYMASLRSNGTESLEIADENINAPGTPMQHMYRQFANQLIAGGDELEITYPSGTQYMSVKGRTIARCNGHFMHLVSLNNVSRNADNEKQNTNDAIVRNIMYLYDAVSEIDIQKNTLHNFDLVQSGSGFKHTEEILDLKEAWTDFIRTEIYLDDHRRFAEFSDMSTMADRIRNSRAGVISDYFRCKEDDGNYHWRVHSVIAIPKTDYQRFMVISRKAPLDDPGIKRSVLQAMDKEREVIAQLPEKAGTLTGGLLWKNVANYADLKFFWKDKERRFIGVSRAFLDYYGMKSEDEVLGKTDEEMNWHVSDGPYRDDEIDVLTRGKHVRDIPGKCIIKGVLHNICASKMPLYQDGKIIGLVGYFVDVDAEDFSGETPKKYTTVDLVTHLSNARGIMESFLGYDEEFEINNKDFVAIGIDVEGYDEFLHTYGAEASNELLRKIADILLKHLKTDASIGRLRAAKFLALYQVADQIKLQSVLKGIKDEIKGLTNVAGHTCTCFPHVLTSFATDKQQLEATVQGFWQ